MQSTGQGSKKIVKCALLFALLIATDATARANISVNPSPMNFGSQTMGVASPSMAVALTNNTRSTIKIVRVSLAPIQFSYSGASLPITLRPGESLIAAVTFTPTAAQAYAGLLTFTRANGMTVTDNLGGLGIQTTVQIPRVTTQPSSKTITAGQTATFTMTATGTAPLSYQWSLNGTPISGATSSIYTTPAETTSANGAQFTVVVSNSAGNVTSSAAVLTVNPAPVAPSITTQPSSQTITAGQTATFSVTATGTAPLSYQWRQNGTTISGATSSTYTTPAETTSASGAQFTVLVTNTAGNATSSAAVLTVNPAPVAPSITSQPSSVTITAGQTATFSVTATGTAPLTYQWSLNGTAISGATSSTYTTPAETTSASGTQFTVVVSNATGNATSSAAILTVNAVPPGRLVAGASALSFGNVNIGSSSSLGVTFTNSGSSNITISNVTISGPGFTASGVSAGLIVTSGQIVTLNVTFAPAATGSVTGSVSVVSNASNSPASITLTGTGVAPISHSGTLNWTASTSTVIGYDVYRGTVSGGPYTKVNSSVDATTTFTDTTVQAGQTYYWVVTAVNSSNVQSNYSNEVSAAIPTP